MVFTEEQAETQAGKVLDKIRDKIKSQIGDAFYQEYSAYLYEHYMNHKDKIINELIVEITDQFVNEPTNYKYVALRKRLYQENKEVIDATLTKDVIEEGIKNILFGFVNNSFPFDWKWKDGIVKFIVDNWDNFKDDDRIKQAFGLVIDRLKSRIDYLEKQLKEILVEEEE